MQKLYLDIDDTLLDTEKFCRRVLSLNGLEVPKGKSSYEYRYSERYSLIIERVLSEYSLIPKKVGAMECLPLLKTEYDVVLCSSYYSPSEGKSKKEFARSLSLPIILCAEGKGSVDMQDGIFVDDIVDNLKDSNAVRKVCFYNKYGFSPISYMGISLVFDWFELLDLLMSEDKKENE